MGYPFDRLPRAGAVTLQTFLTPNMGVQDVAIRFNDRTVDNTPNNGQQPRVIPGFNPQASPQLPPPQQQPPPPSRPLSPMQPAGGRRPRPGNARPTAPNPNSNAVENFDDILTNGGRLGGRNEQGSRPRFSSNILFPNSRPFWG
jgi:hypothetical protein